MNTHNSNALGKIQSVDTSTVIIKIDDADILNNLQINQLITISSTNPGETIIALISKITRKSVIDGIAEDQEDIIMENLIKAFMVGTWFVKRGTENNVFKRTLEVVPSIGAESSLLTKEKLKKFMSSVNSKSASNLEIGVFTIQKDTIAYLNGDKFFQRHAVIVGSTGSGKSWTVATILEQAAKLPSVNNIIFDLHGEYESLKGLGNTQTLKIAGPADEKDGENLIFLPYWLLSYEEIEAMLLDGSSQNAPNQARKLFDLIIQNKKENLDPNNTDQNAILNNFTIDSPIPYEIKKVLEELERLDIEMVPGANNKDKKGDFHGTFTRFIQRLRSKQSDKRLNFLFNDDSELRQYNWLNNLIQKLMHFEGNKKGSKIIDCSEVPSDVLPVVIGLIARIIFSVQQWTNADKRHPIALFCDEAHLYMPQDAKNTVEERGLSNFERIAKEGRKYGIGLVVISQRPADVNRTVLSQCNNFIAMRLTNPDDQNVIKRLFPDSLGNFAELLPILDIGESIIIGDACLLPSRVKIKKPSQEPNSATVDFWQKWGEPKTDNALSEAILALRQQRKQD